MSSSVRSVLIAFCRWVLHRPAHTPNYGHILLMERDLALRDGDNPFSTHTTPPPGRDRVILL